MATLVLTTVGGMVGGPIGAALGAVIGQTVDRSLFPARGREGPRLADLAVQTSRYGAPLPRVFGTMRVAGQVIWATDLVEHRHREGGGKGQPGVTSYSYSVSFAVALSSRPVLDVGRIWADGNLLRGAAGDWKVTTGFRLHRGGEDQPVDPLIASAEGAALTPAHRGLAYAVFDDLPIETFGNRIPSLTFELIADPGAVSVGAIARAIARAIGGDVVRGEGPALPLDGVSAYGESARDVLDMLASVSGAWFAVIGDGLVMRDDAAAARAVVDEDRVRRIAPIERVPRAMSIAHYDPARDWQVGVQQATRSGPGDAARMIEAPFALSASAAKALAVRALARAEVERTTRRVTLDAAAADIAPGDVVSVAGTPWRVTASLFERHQVTLDLVALTPPVLTVPASGGRVSAAPDLLVGETLLCAFEAPPADGQATQPQVAIVAAGTGAGWRRAALQMSLDGGASWRPIGGTAAPGVVGHVAVPAPAGSSTLADHATVIDVTLAHAGMELSDADAAALDSGANLARVGDEFLQFARALPMGGAAWRLSGLWRGRRGSAAGPITAGAPFALLDAEAIRVLPIDAVPGATVALLASGVGDVEGVETRVALTGRSLLPLAPVRLTLSHDATGATVTWRRRSRVDWRWRDGVEAALGEEREAYRVAITGADGTRLEETATPAITLSAADLAGGVTVAVQQLGTHGLSPAATLTI